MKTKLQILLPAFILVNLGLMVLMSVMPTQALAQNNVIDDQKTGVDTYSDPPIAYNGVEGSIRRLLCTPPEVGNTGFGGDPATSNPAGNSLYNCINRLYRFGAAIGAFAGVFFVVLAGYYYIGASESGKQKGKEVIISVGVGLGIIFTSYLLLNEINPSLIEFRRIQPPVLEGVPDKYPTCEEAGRGENCMGAGGKIIPGGGAGGGSGDPLSSTSCATNQSTNCVNLNSEGVSCHAGTGCFAQKAIAEKLKILKTHTDAEGITWSVGQAYPPDGVSESQCHRTGSCVDISFGGSGSSSATNENWAKLCNAAKKVPGTSFLNEISTNAAVTGACGKYVSGGTAPHVHFVISRNSTSSTDSDDTENDEEAEDSLAAVEEGRRLNLGSDKPDCTALDNRNLGSHWAGFFVKFTRAETNQGTCLLVPSSAPARSLASTILKNSQNPIFLWDYHAYQNGFQDGATPLRNIQDMAASTDPTGGYVKTSDYSDVKGRLTHIEPVVLRTILHAANTFGSVEVSEIAGGDHRSDSSHYYGYAVDFVGVGGKKIGSGADHMGLMRLCKGQGAKEIMGPGVKGHNTHVHCGW